MKHHSMKLEIHVAVKANFKDNYFKGKKNCCNED